MRISDWSSDVCSSDLGFLAIAGDDHGGKSSDSAHQSEHTLIAAMLPVLYPATIGEIIEFGLFGIAMSRYSGCYVGLKCITDTLDLTATIELPDPHRVYQQIGRASGRGRVGQYV